MKKNKLAQDVSTEKHSPIGRVSQGEQGNERFKKEEREKFSFWRPYYTIAYMVTIGAWRFWIQVGAWATLVVLLTQL